MKNIRFGLLLLACMLLSHASSASAGPAPSLVDPVARLDYGVANGRPTLLLKVDGLDQAGLADPKLIGGVADLARPPQPPKVASKVVATELFPQGANSRTWLLGLEVEGLLPNTTQPRWLQFSLGGKDVTLQYTLTNAAASKFAWTLRPSPAVAMQPGQAIPLSLAVGPVPANGVTLLQSALIEKSTKAPIAAAGLTLCPTADADCKSSPLNLLPNAPYQLWLRGATGVGTFEGTVTVASAEKPEGDPVAVTVYLTTPRHQALGVATIFAGVVVAWLITVFIRNRINRDQLLMPAASMLKTLTDVNAAYPKSPPEPKTSFIGDRIGTVRTDLSIDVLRSKGLPSRVPAFGVSTNPASLEGYRKHLQTVDDWIQVLKILIHEGLDPAYKAYHSPGANLTLVQEAIDSIDQLAQGTAPPSIESVRNDVHAALDKMTPLVQSDGTVTPDAMSRFFARRAGRIPSPEKLQVEIARLGLIGWLFLLIATTLSGAYILVLGPTAAGFGTRVDFMQCLLWGMGLPVGAQLLQATTGTIATTFGVTK